MTLDDLATFILLDQDIKSLTGNVMYPKVLPPNARTPAITYFRVGGSSTQTTQDRSDLSRTRIQIECWSNKYQDARDLADLVRARLDGYRGVAGQGFIQGAFMVNEMDLYEDVPQMHHVARDYMIWLND